MKRKVGGDGEYYGVQALRAVAALGVVAFHSKEYLQLQNGSVPWELRWIHGQAGVDIFFVISGFVMLISSGRLLTKTHPARIFLWRRVLRIVPLYWLMTLLKLGAVLVHPPPRMHGGLSPWYVVSSFLFIPATDPTGERFPLIPLGWTLRFEMLFYIFFAAALTTRKGVLRILAPSICALALLGLMRTEGWPVWTALANPIVLEFLAGAGVAWLTIRSKLPNAAWAAAMVGIGLASLTLTEPGPSLLTMRPLIWGVPATLIVLGVVALERPFGARLPAWLLMLGNASYSIYLVQALVFPLIHVGMARLGAEFVHTRPVAAGVIMMAASVVITSVAGVGTYLLIERPMTDFLKARWPPGGVRAAG